MIGGLSGVMLRLGARSTGRSTDTYFVVAHFHYVLFGGTVFVALRRRLLLVPEDDRPHAVRAARQVALLGHPASAFNMTFMPMYVLGVLGMPRRQSTPTSGNLGWSTLELISAIGAFIIGAGIILFVVNIVRSLLVGEPAGDDPWDGWTLEWATSSPPAHRNFATLPGGAQRPAPLGCQAPR